MPSLGRRSKAGRKRKRSHDPSDENVSDEPASESSDEELDLARLTLEARKEPRNVAGLGTKRPIPKGPFPHASANARTRGSRTHDLHEQLASLNPPIYAASLEKDKPSKTLHSQHLHVLTSIMHTSLLKGDFIRAGRAWGMILRSNHNGRPIDFRAQDRWGIGAEILLRRDAGLKESVDHEEPKVSSSPISEQSFQLAKDYYEQLILQYPYQRHHAQSVSALAFYPAMFGLLVYQVVETCKARLSELDNMDSDTSMDDDRASPESGFGGSPDGRYEKKRARQEDAAAIKARELTAARQITARLDELLLSPPYDRYNPLLQLRGMMALWVADLYEAISSPFDHMTGDGTSPDSRFQPYMSRQEMERNRENAREARYKARSCFVKIRASGGELPEVVRSIVE